MATKSRKARNSNSGLNVLKTESEAEQARILAEISQDCGPTNFYERDLVLDAAHYTWQKMLYRRITAEIINKAMRPSLAKILHRILLPRPILRPDLVVPAWAAAESLAHGWHVNDPDSKHQVLSLLEEAGLDETAIEAEACMIAADALENAKQMLNSARDGLDEAIRSLVQYREKLAVLVQASTDRLLAADAASFVASAAVN